MYFCPYFHESVGTLNLIHLSVRLSISHKNFNLGHNFCTITGRALILGMCVLCDKTFPMVPCCDLDRDLWPTSRSNLLPSGGPQLSEFACFVSNKAIFLPFQGWIPQAVIDKGLTGVLFAYLENMNMHIEELKRKSWPASRDIKELKCESWPASRDITLIDCPNQDLVMVSEGNDEHSIYTVTNILLCG